MICISIVQVESKVKFYKNKSSLFIRQNTLEVSLDGLNSGT